MEYSFDICYLFGDIFLSEDKKACALIVLPEKKKTTLQSIILDAKLAISCMGLGNLKKAMDREAKIKINHPKGLMYYLWFIGVESNDQGNGIGSKLLAEVIQEGLSKNRPIYLETSTVINIPWYERFGFTIYKELDFGYKLFCLKRE
jgi:ribosomal protein S18 acetylase RimI-like enzyme